ncbi:MAG: hypothetical protein ABRQ39_29415, partial [Candidatus Eremiobacterota bacterium]
MKEFIEHLEKAIEDSDIKTLVAEIFSLENKEETYKEEFRKRKGRILILLWGGLDFEDFLKILSIPSISQSDRADFLSRIVPLLETDLLIKIIDRYGIDIFINEGNLCHFLLEHHDERIREKAKKSIITSVPPGSTVIWQKSQSEKDLKNACRKWAIEDLKKYKVFFPREELILFFRIRLSAEEITGLKKIIPEIDTDLLFKLTEFRIIHESDRLIDETIQNELINRSSPDVSQKAIALIENTLIKLNYYVKNRQNESVEIEKINTGKLLKILSSRKDPGNREYVIKFFERLPLYIDYDHGYDGIIRTVMEFMAENFDSEIYESVIKKIKSLSPEELSVFNRKFPESTYSRKISLILYFSKLIDPMSHKERFKILYSLSYCLYFDPPGNIPSQAGGEHYFETWKKYKIPYTVPGLPDRDFINILLKPVSMNTWSCYCRVLTDMIIRTYVKDLPPLFSYKDKILWNLTGYIPWFQLEETKKTMADFFIKSQFILLLFYIISRFSLTLSGFLLEETLTLFWIFLFALMDWKFTVNM